MVAEKAADLIKESTMTTDRRPPTSAARRPSTRSTRPPATSSAPTRCTPRTTCAAAVARAREAAAWWSALTFDERGDQLHTWKGVITRRIAQLADVVTSETGKPHGDAQLEIALAIEHLALGGQARREGARPRARSPRAC